MQINLINIRLHLLLYQTSKFTFLIFYVMNQLGKPGVLFFFAKFLKFCFTCSNALSLLSSVFLGNISGNVNVSVLG